MKSHARIFPSHFFVHSPAKQTLNIQIFAFFCRICTKNRIVNLHTGLSERTSRSMNFVSYTKLRDEYAGYMRFQVR